MLQGGFDLLGIADAPATPAQPTTRPRAPRRRAASGFDLSDIAETVTPPAEQKTLAPSRPLASFDGVAGDSGILRPRRGAASFGGNQLSVARRIYDIGRETGANDDHIRAALSAGIVESGFNPDAVGDKGTAFGVLQQRPVAGWGKPEQVRDVDYAARKFYERARGVTKYRTPGELAAHIQNPRRDLRGRYDEELPRADDLFNQFGGAALAVPDDADESQDDADESQFDLSGLVDPTGGFDLLDIADNPDDGEVLRVNAADGEASALPSLPPLPERPTPDIYTTDGRATRDARKLTESQPDARVRLDVALPSGRSDWSDVSGGELAQAAVRQYAATKQIPSEFVEQWIAEQGGWKMYDLKTREEKSPIDYIGTEHYDGQRRTMRVSQEMPMLKKLEDDYAESRGRVGRAVDYLTDDQTTAGEKFLGIVEPVAAAGLRGADIATRPLQAVSAGFWSGTNKGVRHLARTGTVGLTPDDIGGVVSDTWNELRGNEASPDARNAVAEAARHSETLRNINPNLPAAVGFASELIVDPTNLIPLGAIAKGGKLLRAGGRVGRAAEGVADVLRGTAFERGFVNPRPLGIAGEAESLAYSLGDLLKAKGVNVAPEDFAGEVVMRASDGRKLLYNSEHGFVVDLTTGEVVTVPEPVRDFMGLSVAEISEKYPQTVDQIPRLIEHAERRAAAFEADAANAAHPAELRAAAADEAARAYSDAEQMRGVLDAVEAHRSGGAAIPRAAESVGMAEVPRAVESTSPAPIESPAEIYTRAADDYRKGVEARRNGQAAPDFQNSATAEPSDGFDLSDIAEPAEASPMSSKLPLLERAEPRRYGSNGQTVQGVPVEKFVTERAAEVEQLPRQLADAEQYLEDLRVQASLSEADAAQHAPRIADIEKRVDALRRDLETVGDYWASRQVEPSPSLYDRFMRPFAVAETNLINSVKGKSAAQIAGSAARTAIDLIQIPKALRASLDWSGIGNGGLPQVLAHPSFLKKALAEQAKATVSQSEFDAFARSIKSHPDFKLMQDVGGVKFSSLGDFREESFASRLSDSIPVVKQSSRAYSAATDALRLQAFEFYKRRVSGKPHTNDETYKAIGELVNLSTGRGVVPVLDRFELGRKLVDLLNVPFFSPRKTASKFNLISPARIVRNMANPATRPVAWLQMRDAGRGLAMFSTTLALIDLIPGVDTGLNPFDKDFGKVRVGGRLVYDVSGGEGVTVRYLAQMFSVFSDIEAGKKVDEKKTPWTLTRGYLRTQLSPSFGVAADYKTGKRLDGSKFSESQAVADLTVPFTVQGAYEAWLDAGGSTLSEFVSSARYADARGLQTGFSGVPFAAPSVLGAGFRVQEQKPDSKPIEIKLSAPAQRELERLRLDLERLGKKADQSVLINPRYSFDGVDGESVRAFNPSGSDYESPDDEYDETMGLDPQEFSTALSRELNTVLTSEIHSSGYAEFATDRDRREYLEHVILNTHERVMEDVRLMARGSHISKHGQIKAQRERLERGEHLKKEK